MTPGGEREGYDVMSYSESEVRRIAHVAFKAAQGRAKRLCSVDKANVLETSQLWRDVVIEVAQDYPDVALTHMYVDNAAMQLVRNPGQIGRASCRERGCQYVKISVCAVSLKKKTQQL